MPVAETEAGRRYREDGVARRKADLHAMATFTPPPMHQPRMHAGVGTLQRSIRVSAASAIASWRVTASRAARWSSNCETAAPETNALRPSPDARADRMLVSAQSISCLCAESQGRLELRDRRSGQRPRRHLHGHAGRHTSRLLRFRTSAGRLGDDPRVALQGQM